MTFDFEDHGLPLVQLKEARRDLVLQLRHVKGSISAEMLTQIVGVQLAIKAVEEVIDDLDAELESATEGFAAMEGRA